MSELETRIPPVVVLLACVALAWMFTAALPGRPLEWALREPLVWLLLLVGVAFSFAAKVAFQRADTTLNPMTPET